jgi:uncharacterized cupin superfamily protein
MRWPVDEAGAARQLGEDLMPRIEIAGLPVHEGSFYPAPYDVPCQERRRVALGDAAGLTGFGVNLLRLAPGQWSSQRHWHSLEDEFVWVLAGEVVLVSDAGEQVLAAGCGAGFKAGEADGHHLQNRAAAEAVVLEVGGRAAADAVIYPDIDLCIAVGESGYRHKDGSAY